MTTARKKRSLLWRVIHFFGSLKLALTLLATIAIACAVATFYESSFDAKIAQAYIYKAPWFIVWLGVLCLNLFAVTLTRWPWQRKHLGFVITHYGIITLLTGAVIGSYFGFEGNVTLHRNQPPVNRITTSHSILQIENPSTHSFHLMPFDPSLSRPSQRHPIPIDIPGSTLKLVADAHADNLVRIEDPAKAALASTFEPSPNNAPGVSGFRARLRAPDGTESPAQWIPSGALQTLTLHDATTRIGYGLELRPVPFFIGLKNFEVPRQEGTETPSNFIATVEFRDAKTGATRESVAQMNHPASWPGGAFAVTTGLNYKFSQAAWNPADLGETTLQVLYDPGWLLKWTGSLAICAGIFIMFYLRPKKL